MAPIRDGSPPPPGYQPPALETGTLTIKTKTKFLSPKSRSSSPKSSSSSDRCSIHSWSSSSSSSSATTSPPWTKTNKKRDLSMLRDNITGYRSGSGSRSRSTPTTTTTTTRIPYEGWSKQSPSLEDILRVFPGNAL